MRAERREHDEAAGLRHVRRAAHDLLLPAATLHHDEAEPALRRMRTHRDDLRDDAVVRGPTELLDPLDLEAAAGEARGEVTGRVGQLRDELTKPAVRGLHRKA